MALSCVYRLRQGFGIGYVVDVLRGSGSEKVFARGHDQLSTYGIGAELSKDAWQQLIRQLIHRGYLEQDIARYSVLRLTPAAMALLRGDETLVLARPRVKLPREPRAAGAAARPARGERAAWFTGGPPARLLADGPEPRPARARRRAPRAAQGAAPAPASGAACRPTSSSTTPRCTRWPPSSPPTPDELLQVNGVGQAKLERYGEAFLAEIAAATERAFAADRRWSRRRHLIPLAHPRRSSMPVASGSRGARGTATAGGGAMRELASSAGTGRAGWRRSAVVLAAALAAVVVAGLAGGLVRALAVTGSPAPAGTTVLKVGWVNEPDNLNPFIGTSTSSFLIFHLNYDMLTGYKASNVDPAPELATSWSHSPDGKVWTFKLRPGVKWQDGVPFTASDVVFTYEYIIRNNMASYTSYTVGIKQVVAVDPLTVRFVCSAPKANMLGMWVPIVPAHIWSKISPKAAQNSFQNNPPHRRHRAVPDGRVQEGPATSAWWPTRATGAAPRA